MKIINEQHEYYKGTDYLLSSGWKSDTDIRFEIQNEEGGHWDIFLGLDELEVMRSFISIFIENEKERRGEKKF